MQPAPLPINEQQRLKVLENYDILDTLAETDYDNIVRLASQICNTPISIISLVDANRQWFKAKVGTTIPETNREIAFCSHAILQNEPFIITDASKDERFSDNPLVKEDPNIKFYAGVPIQSPDGYNLGTLCVIDNVSRTLTEEQVLALRILSREVVNQLELRKQLKIQREMTVQIQDKNEKLETLNQVNNKLLSLIAHDIRNPLATLKATIDLAKEGIITEKDFHYYIHEIGKNLDTVNDLLNNLLDWAIIQFKGQELAFKPIALASFIAHQLEPIHPQLQLKGNTIAIHIPEHVTVTANEHLLGFIIRNLISNANKFTEKGTITCSALHKDAFIAIEIKDTGVGMEPEQIKALFIWEKRSSSVGTQGEKGTGLGLIASYEMVKRMGGSIFVESAKNKGSKFTILLPAATN